MIILSAAVAATALLPSTAHAAVTATMQSPGPEATVSVPVELRVQVSREFLDPETQRVGVRLSADGASPVPGTQAASLTCVSGCGSTDSVWGGAMFHPATGAPFAAAAVCNGRWYLQPSVDGGSYRSGVPITVSAPGSPATSVRVSIDANTATVTWTRAPEPDLAGYRIERRVDGAGWRDVAAVEPRTSRYVDEGLAPDSYEYRVVTLRPDGRTSNGPAGPCADQDPDLETVSASSRGRVTTPLPSPSPSPSPDPADDGDTGREGSDGAGGDGSADEPGTSTGGDGGTDDAGTGGTDPAGSPDGDGDPTDGDAASPAPGSNTRTRVGAPPSARGSRLDADASVPSQPEPEARYFGDGEGFEDEIDYGDADGVVAADDADELAAEGTGTWVEGGISVFRERFVDPERVLRPIATGLVFLTFGLHLRRWMRETR